MLEFGTGLRFGVAKLCKAVLDIVTIGEAVLADVYVC
jgi:hypothetical protein